MKRSRVRFLGEMETWMVEVVGGVAKCQICRKVASPIILFFSEGCVLFPLFFCFCYCLCGKVVVRGIYCTCDPMMGWHKHCMSKQVKTNVEIFDIWKSFNIVKYHRRVSSRF